MKGKHWFSTHKDICDKAASYVLGKHDATP